MIHLRHSVALACVLAAMLGQAPALAGPRFANEDLKGEYLFMVVEVHRVTLAGGVTVPEHCVIAGTATFDGAGRVTLNANQRCNQTGNGAISGTQYYSMNPDGSFLMSEWQGMTDPVRGQLADHGRTLLLDGTLRTLPEITGWWGIAMRR